MKKNINENMRTQLNMITEMEGQLSKVITQGVFSKKVSMADKIMFISQMATSRTRLWEEVYRVYPEIRGLNASITQHYIIYKEELTPIPNTKEI